MFGARFFVLFLLVMESFICLEKCTNLKRAAQRERKNTSGNILPDKSYFRLDQVLNFAAAGAREEPRWALSLVFRGTNRLFFLKKKSKERKGKTTPLCRDGNQARLVKLPLSRSWAVDGRSVGKLEIKGIRVWLRGWGGELET